MRERARDRAALADRAEQQAHNPDVDVHRFLGKLSSPPNLACSSWLPRCSIARNASSV